MKKFLLSLLILLAFTAPVHAEEYVNRCFNLHTGEHLFTADTSEAILLLTPWKYEGICWVAPSNGTPVYRLSHPGVNDHVYTSDPNEISNLCNRHGWYTDFSGRPSFYSGGSIPVYRLYDPARGQHLLTIDENEYSTLPRYGFRQEGLVFRALREGAMLN